MRRLHALLASALLTFPAALRAADRYEAEDAMVDPNLMVRTADAAASGGYYVNMKDGALSFKVTAATAGYYTLWASYKQAYDAGGKVQNLSVNGASKGQIAFPYAEAFTRLKASAKIKLEQGQNTLEILKSWGWVDIDYVEVLPFEATPFAIPASLVAAGSSENARKVYGFLRDKFGKQVVSGFMTNEVMQTDGRYTPHSLETQAESKWIHDASGKYPALMGLDFMHATGKGSDGEWHQGYTRATLAMAEEMYRQGGIPVFCWHWKDPSHAVEAFYSPATTNNPVVTFDLAKAFLDTTTFAAFDTASAEYRAILRDIDIIAGHLKTLADKDVPVLWRPIHESSGRWFWWGYKGPKPSKAVWKLMFDRYVNHHKIGNLIWVWTSDEAGDALDWYPGDDYVDIVGRDYYYYPRVANHGSLVASFEKIKDTFGGRKLIALSENGSVPHPDSMQADGAAWSWFMPWYGDYTMDSWANDNTKADWNAVMNHDFVITLDEMPGWDKYVVGLRGDGRLGRADAGRAPFRARAVLRAGPGWLETETAGYAVGPAPGSALVEIFDLRGTRVATLRHGSAAGPGILRFGLPELPAGVYEARGSIGDGGKIRGKVLIPGR
jgi:mannan endo-1,4-beta-mannosidase